MISSVTETSPVTTGVQKSSMGKDDFMKLLVAQLQYQDPLAPMEGTEFTAQLAQFSTVEQLYKTNETLLGIQEANTDLFASMSVNMIGKKVDAIGNSVRLESGSSSTITFELADKAEEVKITITNSSGENVDTISRKDLSFGRQEVVWSGTNGSGTPMSGDFYFSISAEDADGAPVGSTTFMAGTITGIAFEDAQVFAIIGDKKVPLNTITEIKQNN